MLKQYIPDLLAVTFMIVGPPPMVEATQKLLSSIGIDPQYIKTEQFTGYA
jgi:ferredoxin-NADP reductase